MNLIEQILLESTIPPKIDEKLVSNIIKQVREELMVPRIARGDCGIVSAEVLKRLPYKDFKLYSCTYQGDNHAIISNGYEIIDPTGDQFNLPWFTLKYYNEYKNFKRISQSEIYNLEIERQDVIAFNKKHFKKKK